MVVSTGTSSKWFVGEATDLNPPRSRKRYCFSSKNGSTFVGQLSSEPADCSHRREVYSSANVDGGGGGLMCLRNEVEG